MSCCDQSWSMDFSDFFWSNMMDWQGQVNLLYKELLESMLGYENLGVCMKVAQNQPTPKY